jgi:rubrerythrin
VFLDKLVERIAFAHASSRAYEAVLAKLDGAGVPARGPTRSQLEQMRDDELRHFAIARDALRDIGGDATITRHANVAGAEQRVREITDPRTTFTQCLDVLLRAELADGDGWRTLIDLADRCGFDVFARQFRTAAHDEEQHRVHVRDWIG